MRLARCKPYAVADVVNAFPHTIDPNKTKRLIHRFWPGNAWLPRTGFVKPNPELLSCLMILLKPGTQFRWRGKESRGFSFHAVLHSRLLLLYTLLNHYNEARVIKGSFLLFPHFHLQPALERSGTIAQYTIKLTIATKMPILSLGQSRTLSNGGIGHRGAGAFSSRRYY